MPDRQTVSSAVAAALAEVGERSACLALLGNPAATIARISFRRIAERFGDDAGMRDLMLKRPDLPADVHQMIIRRLGDALGTMMVAKSWAEEERAVTVTRDACDRATVALAAETESDELPALVEHLRVTGQLTTGLLLRGVCAGNVALFETALAVLAHTPVERVASLVRAGRVSVLRAIYSKAGLPPRAFDAFAAALDTWRKIAEEGGIGRSLSGDAAHGRCGACPLHPDQRRRDVRAGHDAAPLCRRSGARGGPRLRPQGEGRLAASLLPPKCCAAVREASQKLVTTVTPTDRNVSIPVSASIDRAKSIRSPISVRG